MTVPFWKLPFQFDVARLQADLAKIGADEWTPHFNKSYYEGEWSGVALRSVRGAAMQLYPDPTAQGNYADTEVLDRCPYFREVLATFEYPLESVRLLKLQAGARIREHKDYNLGFGDGELRIHVPVQTNPDVGFYLSGERIVMNEGESWYVNFNLPHRVENNGQTDRIHLVIDGIVNDWARSIFPPEMSLETSRYVR